MSEFECKNELRLENRLAELLGEELGLSEDLLAEEILKNVNSSAIGRLLKDIADMPEIRQEKVSGVRRQLNQGSYDVNGRLGVALDTVLEELLK